LITSGHATKAEKNEAVQLAQATKQDEKLHREQKKEEKRLLIEERMSRSF
jgi:hypothetical protein